jgi:hypothetical protein
MTALAPEVELQRGVFKVRGETPMRRAAIPHRPSREAAKRFLEEF